jgi:NADPH:quinone reductase-like Zn-dependent oxidoreductase
MSQSTPTAGRWVLDPSQQGFNSLHWDAEAAAATAADLGPEEVLVDLRAASLNYRDLVITKVCMHPSVYG